MERTQDPSSVASFYHLRGAPLAGRACQGLACFAARAANPERWKQATAEPSRLYCLGKCYLGPASSDDTERPHIESRARQTVLLANTLAGGVHVFADYRARGGGEALTRALATTPADIIFAITDSGLRGRGGAGFSAGRKWRAVAEQPGAIKYLAINADEGDPGAFSDRILMEDDPFLLIEGALIAAHAVGARKGYIYLRGEYPLARERLQAALDDARAAGLLGPRVLGANFEFDLEIVIGEGSYLAGEETAMLNAIEGRRAEARARPPQVFERGLHGHPTLVQNVETLCAVPWIVRHGAHAWRALGFSQSRGTKLISLSSTFNRPGLYEIEFGATLREIVTDIGGGLRRWDRGEGRAPGMARLRTRSGEPRALMIGGPLAGLIPPSLFDVRFGYEELQAIGAAVGHGGIIAFGVDTSIADIAHEVFRFGGYESCGKCTPCHLGAPLLERFFQSSASRAGRLVRDDYDDLVNALEAASLCGHGRGLAEFARSLGRHFPEELNACFASA
jgi:formate dehydrogenase iron-sulfur subunit